MAEVGLSAIGPVKKIYWKERKRGILSIIDFSWSKKFP